MEQDGPGGAPFCDPFHLPLSLLQESVFGLQPLFGGSDMLPANETRDLSGRLLHGHSLLQSFYEASDVTVQHRRQNAAHSRSIMSHGSGRGGGSVLSHARGGAGAEGLSRFGLGSRGGQ